LAGGGTGGHLFPALSVAEEFGRRHPAASIVFFGARRGLEQRLVPQSGYTLVSLSLSGLKGASRGARLRGTAAAGWAVLRCVAWMLARRPHLVIGVGGYASGPAVLAALVLRVPTMVLEQNHYPGATNRWLAGRVDAVCLPSEEARRHVRGRTYVTGNPVRPAFHAIGEPPGRPELSLLVFGGSRGARSINRATVGALERLGHMEPPVRLVHQTGAEDLEAMRAAHREHAPKRAEVLGFIEDMPRRLSEADLVVCRAGASTLAELCAAGRPSILVPYPHAADDHQRLNAEALERAGAAIVVADSELDGERLAREVLRLAGDPQRRRAMGRAARGMARPDAARRIVDIAEGLIGGDPVEAVDVP
jgi:UDP-N-acetylglucosamine--N-acetylmuramyl-(pentapeptide) pyrophosphoryl-undecaprenol N-acetylglucosamine transferase